MYFKKIFLVAFLLAQCTINYSTHIELLYSDIQILASGKIIVQSDITYVETEKNKHGIWHTLPVRYSGFLWTNYTTPFQIQSILRDNQPVSYTSHIQDGRINLRIGSPDNYIKPGTYHYHIAYTTSRQIQFYETYEEFAWNILGNESPVPVKKCIAIIHLPSTIDSASLRSSVFTGSYGSKNSNATITQRNSTTLQVETTAPLYSYQGLTTYISWATGGVTRPSKYQEMYQFVTDNPGLLVFFIGFIGLFLFWRRQKKAIQDYEKKNTIIPRFYPPEGLSPILCGYIKQRMVTPAHIAAEIVHVAIQGFLSIKKDKKDEYLLLKNKEASTQPQEKLDQMVMEQLFKNDNVIAIKKPNARNPNIPLLALLNQLQKAVNQTSIVHALTWHTSFLLPLLLGILLNLGIVSVLDGYLSPLTAIPSVIFFIRVLFYLPGYTPEGRKLRDEIDGFALYLKTAEIDRWRVIGTPPERTPELFEKYLPYAMVLGLEEAWTKQFTPYFEQWEREGRAYQPHWFIGSPLTPRSFKTFSSTYATATYPPTHASAKSSTGRFGGGSVGGGRGGGGTGSW